MTAENPPIIADRLDAPAVRRTALWVFGLAFAAGGAAAWYYAEAGLTLSHYDARAHLVVARRVVDSLTPGWRQLGAIWLPLPHVLNVLPVQWDWSYRTGFSGVALSIVALAWGLAALSRYLMRHVDSPAAAIAIPLAVLANPGVLYLQSTPMTEPMLFGLAFVSLLTVDTWVATGRQRHAHQAGAAMAALLLVRYEGWLIAAALVMLAWVLRPPRARNGWWWLAVWPAGAVVAFMGLSYATAGALLATSGFYTPTNPARGSAPEALRQVFDATVAIAGPAVMILGALGVVAAFVFVWRTQGRSLLCLSLLASAALPFTAFYSGHPERVRYMVTVAVGVAACGGLAFAALPRPARAWAAAAFLAIALIVRPPLTPTDPMVVEAQWATPYSVGRRAVTAYLAAHHDGTPILASMSALAHYMQEVAAVDLPLRAFLHEGNGLLWDAATEAPRRYVRWILIEEQARGGGPLAILARQDPLFLDGFERVAEGGGVALYRLQSSGDEADGTLDRLP
jgi:hypothetical protein